MYYPHFSCIRMSIIIHHYPLLVKSFVPKRQPNLCRGVDSQFVLDNPSAGPAEVTTEVKRRIDEMALPSGGYIVGPSHTVPYDPDKLQAMKTAIEEYGQAVYQR